MTALIIIGTGLGLALFGRVCYNLGVGKGYQMGQEHFQNRFINKIKSQSQTRDGEPQVFRG